MLAGHCETVIVASVKQGEMKKQERAVLYLADYPHASSRLQGERADSLNREERAEHRQKHARTLYKHLNGVWISKLFRLEILSLAYYKLISNRTQTKSWAEKQNTCAYV